MAAVEHRILNGKLLTGTVAAEQFIGIAVDSHCRAQNQTQPGGELSSIAQRLV
jgi:hypothetical protein